MLRRIQTAVVTRQQTPTKRPPTLSKAKRTQRQIRNATAPLLPTLNKAKKTQRLSRLGTKPPPPTLSKAKKPQRRNRIETGPPLLLRTNNSSKAFATVKNFAPDCCNNSTLFLRPGIPLAASS